MTIVMGMQDCFLIAATLIVIVMVQLLLAEERLDDELEHYF